MSGPIYSDPHRVGGGFVVRFTLSGAGRFDAVWTPRVPNKREMRRVLDRYRGARSAFMAEVAKARGQAVVLMELPS